MVVLVLDDQLLDELCQEEYCFQTYRNITRSLTTGTSSATWRLSISPSPLHWCPQSWRRIGSFRDGTRAENVPGPGAGFPGPRTEPLTNFPGLAADFRFRTGVFQRSFGVWIKVYKDNCLGCKGSRLGWTLWCNLGCSQGCSLGCSLILCRALTDCYS